MCNRSDVDFGEESQYKRISLWLVLSFFTFMNSYQLTYIHTWQYYVSLQLSPYECAPAIRITGFVTRFDPEREAQVRLRHVQGYLYLLQLRAPLPQVCINQWMYVYVCMYVPTVHLERWLRITEQMFTSSDFMKLFIHFVIQQKKSYR